MKTRMDKKRERETKKGKNDSVTITRDEEYLKK